ncbi:DMT family transporter [Parenemella sanctibonifatiensis]|uniref:Ligand-binding protein SH3 n=1 Tax=Parenemella sanctibonifatiensis TaxID=2016505 RepID=A0A255EI08_9ACTN|nr:multidrug efflux SMR transporter [Parenemella sanctibonifatiensis]OYN91159.1 ligand-binding protein SH3 [Parenemella sanctibonifatiensis]
MAWVILLASAVLEAVWATAMGASNGFTELVPSIVFFVALAGSMWGLAHAARTIPIGTAYAVWSGAGAALTVAYAVITGTESLTWGKAIFLVGIIGAVVGLKLVGDSEPEPAGAGDPDAT